MIYALFYLNLLFFNYENVNVTIYISKEIQSDKVVILSGTIYNGSTKRISFWETQLFKSLYKGDTHWDLVILKNGKRYFIPLVFFEKRLPPEVIKLKKNEKYFFEIFVSFKELSTDRFSILDNIKSGYYEVQLTGSLKTPKNTTIKSNKVEFHFIYFYYFQ